jgi:hypothetical protein
MRACRFGVPIFLLAACGPETKEPADLDRVCGHESPFRILEIDDDRELASVVQTSHEDGRRELRLSFGELVDHPFPFPDGPTYEYWSVGTCGESPQRLSDDISLWTTLDHWPDEIFECDSETGLFEIVDPEIEGARNVVFDTQDCRFAETPWGVVEVVPSDEDLGTVVLLPYPEDPWTETSQPRTLLEDVRIRSAPPYGVNGDRLLFAYRDDAVYALSAAYDLVRFSLLDGSTTIEAANVREFELSYDEGWLIWQDVAEIGDDPKWPVGAIYLKDRDRGAVTRLADAPLAATVFSHNFAFIDLGVVLLQLGYLYDQPERVYRTADFSFSDFPLGVVPDQGVTGDRVLVGDAFGHGNYAIVDPITGTGADIFDGYGEVNVRGDHLEILDGAHCCIREDERAEARLWTAELDGTRELLAHRVTRDYQYLSDGRIVTMLDVNSKWRGDLVVIDSDDLGEHVVDEHTIVSSPIVDDDTIVYGVADRDRTGVWLARLAAD